MSKQPIRAKRIKKLPFEPQMDYEIGYLQALATADALAAEVTRLRTAGDLLAEAAARSHQPQTLSWWDARNSQ